MAQAQPRSKTAVVKKESEYTANAVMASLDIQEPEPVNGKVSQRTVLHDGTIREDY